MNPVALLVAYDGTGFAGWQVQPGRPTVQGTIQAALDRVHGVPPGTVSIAGSGRTDAGVHAVGQVASYTPPTRRAPGILVLGLARLLPEAIRVLDAWEAEPGFHACRSARGKIYRYRIVNRPNALPFELPWAWHVWPRLDVDAMRAAAARLVGTHDFAAFANAGGQAETTVRTLRRLAVTASADAVVDIEAEADGFLYRMVRNLAGFLVQVGRGRRPPSDAVRVLASGRRAEAGMTAPPRGLCLVRALYADDGVPPRVDARVLAL